MNYNNDFKYDLKVGQVKEEELGEIFNSKTIEVKYDLQAMKTGNVYIEYFSRGKASGISTSQADYYCFCIGDTFHLIQSSILKERCTTLSSGLGTRLQVQRGNERKIWRVAQKLLKSFIEGFILTG